MCKCGKINLLANVEYFPIEFDPESQSYSLFVKELSPILLRNCFECGCSMQLNFHFSDEICYEVKDHISCKCGLMKELSEDFGSAVDFSEKLRGYVIYTASITEHLKFCISCGGILPQHKTYDVSFFDIDLSERKKVEEKIKSVSGILEIIEELGNPDFFTDSTDLNFDSKNQVKKILQYGNIGKTFDLIVQEYSDENMELVFMPKIKEQTLSADEQSIIEKIKNAQTSDEVIEQIGQPEKQIKFFYSLVEQELLIYKELDLSSNLFVKIFANGKLDFSFA